MSRKITSCKSKNPQHLKRHKCFASEKCSDGTLEHLAEYKHPKGFEYKKGKDQEPYVNSLEILEYLTQKQFFPNVLNELIIQFITGDSGIQLAKFGPFNYFIDMRIDEENIYVLDEGTVMHVYRKSDLAHLRKWKLNFDTFEFTLDEQYIYCLCISNDKHHINIYKKDGSFIKDVLTNNLSFNIAIDEKYIYILSHEKSSDGKNTIRRFNKETYIKVEKDLYLVTAFISIIYIVDKLIYVKNREYENVLAFDKTNGELLFTIDCKWKIIADLAFHCENLHVIQINGKIDILQNKQIIKSIMLTGFNNDDNISCRAMSVDQACYYVAYNKNYSNEKSNYVYIFTR